MRYILWILYDTILHMPCATHTFSNNNNENIQPWLAFFYSTYNDYTFGFSDGEIFVVIYYNEKFDAEWKREGDGEVWEGQLRVEKKNYVNLMWVDTHAHRRMKSQTQRARSHLECVVVTIALPYFTARNDNFYIRRLWYFYYYSNWF